MLMTGEKHDLSCLFCFRWSTEPFLGGSLEVEHFRKCDHQGHTVRGFRLVGGIFLRLSLYQTLISIITKGV